MKTQPTKTVNDDLLKRQGAFYLLQLVKGIVNFPERVKIEGKATVWGLQLKIVAAEQDKGLIIGSGGSTIAAIAKVMEIWSRINSAAKVKIFVESTKEKINA